MFFPLSSCVNDTATFRPRLARWNDSDSTWKPSDPCQKRRSWSILSVEWLETICLFCLPKRNTQNPVSLENHYLRSYLPRTHLEFTFIFHWHCHSIHRLPLPLSTWFACFDWGELGRPGGGNGCSISLDSSLGFIAPVPMGAIAALSHGAWRHGRDQMCARGWRTQEGTTWAKKEKIKPVFS